MKKAIHIGMSIIAVALMAVVIVKPSIADNVVLMESKHLGYWEYLNLKNVNVKFIESEYKDNSKNLLFITRPEGTYNYGDIKVTINKDSSINIKGDNNVGKDIWFEFSTGNYLIDGFYYYTDANNSNEMIHSYVVGRKYIDSEFVKSDLLDISGGFIINNNDYNYYIFGVRIYDGAKNLDETFFPMVSTEKNCEYEAAWFKDTYYDLIENVYSVAYFILTEEEYCHIDEADINILLNSMEANHTSYDEVLIEIVDVIGNILYERDLK